MNIGLSRIAKAGMVALAMLTGATSISIAAPYGAISTAPVQANQPNAGLDLPVVNIRDSRFLRRGGDGGRWHGNGYRRGGWRNNGGWRGNDGWRDGRRHRNYYGSAAVLGLGLGLLAAPRYYYDSEPRRVYRTVGNSHVQWCYNRYRSYRAADNTFQPYNGPRQQCYSPY